MLLFLDALLVGSNEIDADRSFTLFVSFSLVLGKGLTRERAETFFSISLLDTLSDPSLALLTSFSVTLFRLQRFF